MQQYPNRQKELLAYRLKPGPVTLVYLGGFRSDMQGEKALHFEALAKCHNLGSLFFDYSGHGRSEGEFAQKSPQDWLDDALLLIDTLTQGPLILVGSSMGAWLMLHVALQRSARILALMGLASAPDFVGRLIWSAMNQDHKNQLESQGTLDIPELNVNLSQKFFDDGLALTVLDKLSSISCPIRLIHGLEDSDVPWQLSLEILNNVASQDAHLHLIKDGCHRLNKETHLHQLTHNFASLLASLDV